MKPPSSSFFLMTRSPSLIMDIIEVEENLFAVSDAKLHGQMCKILSAMYCKVLSIFPSLEAAKPRSKSGIQALCSLHVAMEKTKNILQHCSECSKLYLAITGESVLSKFGKARFCLADNLKQVEDIVPQSVGFQIQEIICQLESIEFSLDPLEKQVGNDLIILLQQERKASDSIDNNEFESFHQAALRLGIISSRTALTERRALKKLIEKARSEEDKRKESIVAYLLHLMRKYSKLFRNKLSDENNSPVSTPCSPEEISPGCINQTFERQLLKHSSIIFKPGNKKSGQMTIPPEELRCPISLHLMYDPVIIASGQTYDRSCIEKWFNDGHSSCPKTQQKLSHLSLTPNYCVKSLIASWCERNGVPLPVAPPESLDLNYWRPALSECESVSSRSMDILGSCKLKGVKVVPLEESCIIAETEGIALDRLSAEKKESDLNIIAKFEYFRTVLNDGEDLKKKCMVVEQIRFLLKDDEEARMVMGTKGFVQTLLKFLQLAVKEGNSKAQESGAMALFNLAVNNCRNKEIMLEAGVISLLEQMILNSDSHEYATALYLNLSCLEDAKHIIGLSCAVPFLCHLFQTNAKPLCKLDALHTLYNLSTLPSNISYLLSAGVITGLQSLLADPGDHGWTERAIAVLIHLALTQSGKDEMRSASGLISALSRIVDCGEGIEQEQSVSCLLILCDGNENCSQMVLQEGVIPGLVSMSVNGTARGREKAQKLLMLFREQRQREQPPTKWGESGENFILPSQTKPLCKSTSRRRVGKALSFLWKSKSHSVNQW